MTIEELIAELEKIKEEHGNIEVRVQNREDCGYDENIRLYVEKEYGDEEEHVLL